MFNYAVCINRRMKARIPGKTRIAPVATNITTSQSYKPGCFTGMKSLSLYCKEFFYKRKLLAIRIPVLLCPHY
jgi:hypothetical protein